MATNSPKHPVAPVQGADADEEPVPSFLSPFHQALLKQQRPVIRRIRELLPDIVSALSSGYTRENIVQALKESEGIEISKQMLSTYLQRLRQTSTPALPNSEPSLSLPASEQGEPSDRDRQVVNGGKP